MKKGDSLSPLEEAIMLQVNQRLYDRGVLSRALYEEAKVRIVARAARPKQGRREEKHT